MSEKEPGLKKIEKEPPPGKEKAIEALIWLMRVLGAGIGIGGEVLDNPLLSKVGLGVFVGSFPLEKFLGEKKLFSKEKALLRNIGTFLSFLFFAGAYFGSLGTKKIIQVLENFAKF